MQKPIRTSLENRTFALSPLVLSKIEEKIELQEATSRSEYIRNLLYKWLPILNAKKRNVEGVDKEKLKVFTINIPEKVNDELENFRDFGFTSANELVRAIVLMEQILETPPTKISLPVVQVELNEEMQEKIIIENKAYKVVGKGAGN